MHRADNLDLIDTHTGEIKREEKGSTVKSLSKVNKITHFFHFFSFFFFFIRSSWGGAMSALSKSN